MAGSEIYKGETTVLVRVFSPPGPSASDSFSVTGIGSGFGSDEAKRKSEEDTLNKLAARLKAR